MNLKLCPPCLLLAGLLAGCTGVPFASERAARREHASVADIYRPGNQRPALPGLSTNSGLGDFLRYAMLNQPKVEAAYYDWAAAVERTTTARSLPDPRLTFEMDIADMITSLMPGLMMDLPGPGKRTARAEAATAETAAKYFAFEASVLQAAFEVKRAYYQFHFLQEKIRVNQQTLTLLDDLERLARAQNAVGKVTLQDVLRAQIEQDRLTTEIANLEDSQQPLLARLKAALGLAAGQENPPLPARFESTLVDFTSDQLFATALQRNPRLRAMEAEVRLADAAITLARKGRVPDFNVGLELDVKAAPVIWNPQAGMTLPIWRDKIAAEIAAAQAGKRAAEARLSAEQIALAIEFAEKLFLFRESTRTLALLQDRLLPKQRQSLAVARSGYVAGQIDFFNLIDAEQTLLRFAVAEVEARTQRELALAELSLVILGVPPANAPILAPPAKPLRDTRSATH